MAVVAAQLFTSCGCSQAAPVNNDPESGSGVSDVSRSANDESVATSDDGLLHLADFDVFPVGDESWSEADTIACTGQDKGYIYSRESFGNGELMFEYRYPAGLSDDVIPNTGVLLLIEPPHKKWPRCVEAQGKQSEAGQLKGNGGVDGLEPVFDEAALSTAIRPPGEWNVVEVTICDDQIVAKWNGQETARCGRGGLSDGPFGFQSEGNPVEFRNIQFVSKAN